MRLGRLCFPPSAVTGPGTPFQWDGVKSTDNTNFFVGLFIPQYWKQKRKPNLKMGLLTVVCTVLRYLE